MNHIMGALLILCFLQQGCTSTYVLTSSVATDASDEYSSYEGFTRRIDGHIAAMYLADGTTVRGHIVSVGPDSISWQDSTTNALSSLSMKDIDKIECSDGYCGLQGFTIGLVVGVVPVLMTGAWNYSIQEGMDPHTTYPWRIVIPPWIILTSTVGGIWGANTPHYYVFRVQPDRHRGTGSAGQPR